MSLLNFHDSVGKVQKILRFWRAFCHSPSDCTKVTLGTKDSPRFIRYFWEVERNGKDWEFMQSSVNSTGLYGGMENIVYWQQGQGILHQLAAEGYAILAGSMAHGKPGVLVSQVGSLYATLYSQGLFEKSAAVVLPNDASILTAVWAFCHSKDFSRLVRKIDRKLAVTNRTLVKVPFDLDYWTQVAQEKYPNGLPPPYSNDPTQWLFGGHPAGSTDPLQVAVARLLGYHWPQQTPDALAALAHNDGIVCLPAVNGEPPAVERLRALLVAAYSQPPTLPDPALYHLQSPDMPFAQLAAGWSLAVQQRLLAHVGFAGKSLDDWLYDSFFEQHCQRFHNRPFIWHIGDGRRDGFHALVNYHRLDAICLNRLIYTYLGDWINTQRAAREAGVAGADGRLVAALALQKQLVAIAEGEPPYDLYVRWKPLARQPLGWQPDLNDGVRLNIRPFVLAGILRRKFTIHWHKDRGANPDGSERINDRHFSRAEKIAAAQQAQTNVSL